MLQKNPGAAQNRWRWLQPLRRRERMWYDGLMRWLAILLVLTATPAQPQDAGSEGRDLMAEALRLFMRGLLEEMEPALDDLNSLLENFDAYHQPEMLPNGDIIIRRRTPLRRNPEGEDGEIEL